MRALRERRAGRSGRRWLFVPYDQLTDELGPLSREEPGELGVVLVESPWKAARRPYHKQKLALVVANLRHFALEQAARGVAVRHVVAPGDYRSALEPLVRELGPLRCMEPAERELREDLAPLVRSGGVELLPHEGWLTTREQFFAGAGREPPWRMDRFYRHVRKETGILVDARGRPAGGKLSFDRENRRPFEGDPAPPTPPAFAPDEITFEVCELVTARFAAHPGDVAPEALPATRDDAETLWRWALASCLPSFGPFEDAMSRRSSGLFHTRISPLLNLHRLLPGRVLDDALAAAPPLASLEGFVRQVLGWREFVRHVHRETDGFRRSPSGVLGAARPLPAAYWGERSGLACLDHVVAGVWREAWSHHITRLMVLSNIAQLLDASPRELTDWFWIAYVDAYDWVVEPNVLGMGTFSAGDVMTTKPYVSGAGYIDRMSDHCSACAFDPKRSCPLTDLYWAYLGRHAKVLARAARMGPVLGSLARRPASRRRADARVFEHVSRTLAEGRALEPSGVDRVRARR